jgi:DNA-binding beta-propeller fold protein YncE
MFTKFVQIAVLTAILTSCGRAAKSLPGKVTSLPETLKETLHWIQSIPLPNVEGRLDHLSADLNGQRLFVAALGNNSVEVVDLRTGKLVRSISGFSEPQGILYIPEFNKLYVANGGTGLLEVLDGGSFAEMGHVQLSGDADNIRYDSASDFVVVGYGDGGLSFINAENGKVVRDIRLNGHPEAFQLESSGSKSFVNIPSLDQIAVVDRQQQKTVAAWLMTHALGNYPMALDESGHHLFVGFRVPAKLGVFDTETGNLVASLDSTGDVDDLFYDPVHKIIFAIGGEGYVDLFSQQAANHYQLLTSIATGSGARTGLWVPEQNRLYVAAPQEGARQARILVYELQP